ncbi:MAG: cell division protein ZapA [Acidobacteria bacterium]|nr:cell division protein ZapA [Acidobacteriota bacterium]MCW5950515.1 cell division protein ZapA [Pyrinomonadaceae bacterium]
MNENENSAGSVRVEIYNQTYSIRSDGDNNYINDLSQYVDGKMREISSGTHTVDSLKVAILAALHIADELHQAKYELAQVDMNLGQRSSECSERLDRVLKSGETPPYESLNT